MPSPGSPRNYLIDVTCNLFRECLRPRTRLLLITVVDRGGDTNQSGVSAVQAHRVIHQIKLTPVFAGHYTAVRLVPIQHELFVQTLANDVKINGHLTPIVERELVDGLRHRRPSCSRQTVLGRVNGGAGALTAEIPDVQGNQALGLRDITAVEVVCHPKQIDGRFVKWPVGASSVSPDLSGKLGERLGGRGGFSRGQGRPAGLCS